MQVLGGWGYCDEFKVERFLRDAKLLEIGGGTLEIAPEELDPRSHRKLTPGLRSSGVSGRLARVRKGVLWAPNRWRDIGSFMPSATRAGLSSQKSRRTENAAVPARTFCVRCN